MIPAAFAYHAPTSLREALALLRRYPGQSSVVAGGHSLVPMMKLRLAQPTHVIDLGRGPHLVYIRELDGGLAIGTMTTYYMLQSFTLVQERAPALAEAAGLVADIQVRNKGTLGGSLAHADPAADLPAVIVALEARIQTVGGGRSRSIAAHRFFVDMFSTALRERELITEIRIPALPARSGSSYQKFANKASHFAVVGVAASVTLDEEGICQKVRVGITGAGPKAVRTRAVERYLQGREPSEANIEQAARRATRGIEFQEDIHGSAEYREHLTRVFTNKALAEAVRRVR